MRKILVSIVTSAALAACASSGPPPAPKSADTPATASDAVLELGEITVFDGAQAALKLHADGTTELGGHSGGAEVKPGQPASSDSLPIVWKPGPVIKTDGTFAMNGEAVLKVSADGKVIDVKKNEPLPLTLATDAIHIVEGGQTYTLGLGDDGKLTFAGGDAPAVLPRVEGANTPGKRRTVLVFVALMMATGEGKATPPPASTPPVP